MAVLVASGVADASGNVTLSFPAPGQGVAFAGTVAVPLSPAGAVWTAMLAGTPLGSWSGPSAWGPVAASGSEVFSLQGSGLTAGQSIQATWTGSQGSPESYARVIPGATATHGTATISGPVTATISGDVPTYPVSGYTWPTSTSPPTGMTPIDASGASPLTLWAPSSATPVEGLLLTVAAATTAGTVVLSAGGTSLAYLWAPTSPGTPLYLPLGGLALDGLTLSAGTAAGNLSAYGAVVLG